MSDVSHGIDDCLTGICRIGAIKDRQASSIGLSKDSRFIKIINKILNKIFEFSSLPDISPPLACIEINSVFYDILKLKKTSKFKKYFDRSC